MPNGGGWRKTLNWQALWSHEWAFDCLLLLSARQLNPNSLSQHCAQSSCKCTKIFSGFALRLAAKKIVRHIGGLSPTICGFYYYYYCLDIQTICKWNQVNEINRIRNGVWVITKSSPQWWPGCSATAHFVLDLPLPIWGFGESCAIGHCITSQPANVSSVVLSWHLLAAVWKGDFSTPRCGGFRGAL